MDQKKIILVLEGGIIQSVSGIPEGVTLEVRDYDIEAYDTEVLTRDESGDECHISEYTSRD